MSFQKYINTNIYIKYFDLFSYQRKIQKYGVQQVFDILNYIRISSEIINCTFGRDWIISDAWIEQRMTIANLLKRRRIKCLVWFSRINWILNMWHYNDKCKLAVFYFVAVLLCSFSSQPFGIINNLMS